MATVAEYKFGNTRVYIDDEDMAKTPEQEEQVRRDFAAASWPIIDRMLAQGSLPDRYIVKSEMLA